MGFRFRLNGKVSRKICKNDILPRKPDIVLSRHNTVVFVHGCFWHRHMNCKDATMPKTRAAWWLEKLSKNVERDLKVRKQLEDVGWKIIVV